MTNQERNDNKRDSESLYNEEINSLRMKKLLTYLENIDIENELKNGDTV